MTNDRITVSRELLRQALETLTCTGEDDEPGHRCGYCDDYVDRNGPVRKALRAALDKEPAPVQEPVPQAVQTVIAAMQADPGYAWSWHCNIAMAYVDAGGDPHTGNQGAARFMKMLANVDPAHELPQQPAPPADVPLLSDEEIGALVREASKGGAINRDGSTSQRIARAIEQAVRRNAGLK